MKIRKLLVANRSEIAIRVFRAANELGIATVAIWAEEDKYALSPIQGRRELSGRARPASRPRHGPDSKAICPSRRCCASPNLSGADAIHPGYGLLSESPEFRGRPARRPE